MKKYSWSLDLSTTNVGMALWENDSGKLIELTHLQLKIDRNTIKEDRYLVKAKMFNEYVETYKRHVSDTYNAEIDNVFIEEPFKNTSVNINTTALLLEFNGIACYILNEIFNTPPLRISVHDSRKIFCPELIVKKKRKGKIVDVLSFPKDVDKKHYIWEKVSASEPNIQWFYKKDKKKNLTDKIHDHSYDMADAYVVGHCGLRVLGLI